MSFKSCVSIGYKADGRVYVSISVHSKRFRFSNGATINQDIYPNRLVGSARKHEAEVLRAAFVVALRNGWLPTTEPTDVPCNYPFVMSFIRQELQRRLKANYSGHYKRDISGVVSRFELYLLARGLSDLRLDELSPSVIRGFLDSRQISNRSKRNFKAYLSTLFKGILEENNLRNPFTAIKLAREIEVLHRPFKDVRAVLDEIFQFDKRLHLCCILAFGCLLRPHREILELKWCEFSSDLTQISLSGSRNKGKKNRIVPVPEYVRPFLQEMWLENTDGEANIFTGTAHAFNRDFFKTLWGRYKRTSQLLGPNHTLYSFRHTGAIRVYEKSGSLVTLQQVMGHSSLQVSITYLRGLEVKSLNMADMPSLT